VSGISSIFGSVTGEPEAGGIRVSIPCASSRCSTAGRRAEIVRLLQADILQAVVTCSANNTHLRPRVSAIPDVSGTVSAPARLTYSISHSRRIAAEERG